MKLNIADIEASGTDIRFSEIITLKGEIEQESPVEAILKAYRDGTSVYINGEITTDINVQCSRCLEEFRTDMHIDVDMTCLPVKSAKGMEERKELTEEELNVTYYANDAIDISGLIGEQVTVSMPVKPLCSSDCKGLCVTCGTNLNKGTCDCKADIIDERWMKLKNLMNERKD